MRKWLGGCLAGGVLALFTLPVNAAFEFDGVGLRVAKATNKFSGMYQQGVSFSFRRNNPLPKFFYPASLELTVGRFERGSENVSFISFGPSFRPEIGWFKDSRWFFDYGIHPTILRGSKIEPGPGDSADDNLGGDLQFTSHIGIGRYFGKRREWAAWLRFQHTSNGRLNTDNPGVDMIALEVSYSFRDVRARWNNQ
ncbi:MAG: acyloxyacyl hydrolase [Gammaproteobacteria bacterium]|nr:acyloxyacyl hydrolase [Gammaproteobacteria bacterium]